MMKYFFVFLICFVALPISVNAHIVDGEKVYTYESLTEDMLELVQKYPHLVSYKSLTTTSYGRSIWAIKLGHGDTTILLNGAHHAREWMTSALLMKMIETYAEAYDNKQPIDQLHPNILNKVTIWFVPMVNPDGVTLQQFGLYAFPAYIHDELIKMNEGSTNFRRWKANIHGIDLNRQYPANWENLNGVSEKPSYQFYKGTEPLEAEEVKALVDFTYETQPEIAVSYHSSGNVLFWGYHIWGLTHTTDFTGDFYNIAQEIENLTKYKLEHPESYQQGGGYTDWFVEEFEKPGLTVEIGDLIEDNSLPLTKFRKIWEKNKGLGLFVAKKALERKK